MRSYTATTPAITIFAGLALIGTLAGCSTPAADSAAAATGASSTRPSTAATASTYKDGTYTESADYQAPSGTETVDVTLTLAGGVVTAVTVQGHANDPQAKLHQGQFASGIAGVVVGKNINDLQVDKVGGSSLTSGGFNAAVEEIKADAAA
jgi:uncharacterized protein with FMN-binding domain